MDPRLEAFYEYCEELVLDATVLAAARNGSRMPPGRISEEFPFKLRQDHEFFRIKDAVFYIGLRRLVRRGLVKAERDPLQPNSHAKVYTLDCGLLERLALAARSPETETGEPEGPPAQGG